MNPMAAASPPLIPSDPRRARLRGHPSGLKGRCAITTVTDLRPALDPGASAAPHAQRHGQHQRRCPPERAALTQNPYKSSLYGSGGLPQRHTPVHVTVQVVGVLATSEDPCGHYLAAL